jgi:predicted O-methyltransferase YrrM
MTTAYLTEAAQDEREITAYCDLLGAEGVRSYLEVGSKFGGSLWRAANALPKGSRIVSVDLPAGTKAWPASRLSLAACVEKLKEIGYDAHLIWGNSTDPATIEAVRALGPFDAMLIDADHRWDSTRPEPNGVAADWVNYARMGRMVAFHDIAWKRAPEWVGMRINVPEFWASIRSDYARTQEFCFDETGKNNGIGVLWR